jgi:hypothetical protein
MLISLFFCLHSSVALLTIVILKGMSMLHLAAINVVGAGSELIFLFIQFFKNK